MSVAANKIAFWLLPAAEAHAFFSSLIENLSDRFVAPVFEPHVTLHVAEVDQQTALDALRVVCASTGPVELMIGRVAFSPLFTKTLFVQLQSAPDAQALSVAVRAALPGTSDYQFDPHLSLLYQHLPEGTKRAAAFAIQLPFERVEFDRVKVIVTPAEIRTAGDVAAWRTLGECPLGPR